MKKYIIFIIISLSIFLNACSFLGIGDSQENIDPKLQKLSFDEIYNKNIDVLSQKINVLVSNKLQSDYLSQLDIDATIKSKENNLMGNLSGYSNYTINSKHKLSGDNSSLTSLLDNDGELYIVGVSKLSLTNKNVSQSFLQTIEGYVRIFQGKLFFKLDDLLIDSNNILVQSFIKYAANYMKKWYYVIDLNLIKDTLNIQTEKNYKYDVDFIDDIVNFLKDKQLINVDKEYVQGDSKFFEYSLNKQNLRLLLEYISEEYDQLLDKTMIDDTLSNINLNGKIKAKSLDDIEIIIDNLNIAGTLDISGIFNLENGNLDFISVNDGVKISTIFKINNAIDLDLEYFEGSYNKNLNKINVLKEKSHLKLKLHIESEKKDRSVIYNGNIVLDDYNTILKIFFNKNIQIQENIEINEPEEYKQFNQLEFVKQFIDFNPKGFGF